MIGIYQLIALLKKQLRNYFLHNLYLNYINICIVLPHLKTAIIAIAL